MVQSFCLDLPRDRSNVSRLLLAFCWLLGLLCGILVNLSAAPSFSLMLSSLRGSVSIVLLLCVTTLPFLLSAFAVYLSRPAFLFLISFCKAFLFAFVSFKIVAAFDSAGWLIRWLLCFSDCASVQVLYCYWLRHLPGERPFCRWEAVFCLALEILISSIDYGIISPFLSELIDF